MKWHRIQAILIRHLYLYRRSFPRLMDIFYWPVMDLLLWGFLSFYLSRFSSGFNIITVLIGALILWDLLSQSQRVVSVAFLEDIWERNLINIFVTPLKISEFLISTIILGFIRIFMVAVILSLLAFALYHFNIFVLGFYLVPFVINLLWFGWSLGIFTTAIILRYGSVAQVLAFGLIFLIQPFSAVFYPVSALPEKVRYVSTILPPTHVFEGMRSVLENKSFSEHNLLVAVGLNIIYLLLVVWFFLKMFSRIKEKGMLAKLE